jgi:hypothetical protein
MRSGRRAEILRRAVPGTAAPQGRRRRMRRTCCACLALLSLPALPAPVRVGDFAATQGVIPAPWRVEQPDPKVPATRYRARLWDGVHAVEAHAVASMALLARPVAIDLAATPILCWRWRIDAPLQGADMTRKSGDDYAARVYLSFEVAPERLGVTTRMALGLARGVYGAQLPDAAINYIWDNRHASAPGRRIPIPIARACWCCAPAAHSPGAGSMNAVTSAPTFWPPSATRPSS